MTHRHFPFISSDLQPCYSSTDQHTPRPSPSAPQGLTNHRLSHPFTVPTSNDHLHPSDEFCACHKPSHYSEACVQAKQHVQAFPKMAQREFAEIGEMTYMDIWGPAQTRAVGGTDIF